MMISRPEFKIRVYFKDFESESANATTLHKSHKKDLLS